MRKALLVSCAAALALGYAASAWAQCLAGNPRDLIFAPAKANKFQATLVQAMTSCTLPDTATGGGTPACSTVAPLANRWAWCEGGSGQVSFKAGPAKSAPLPPSPLPTGWLPGDIGIKANLKGVCWGASGPAPGTLVGDKTAPVPGTLQLVGRPTLEDSVIGVVQIIDFPAPVPFGLAFGKGKVKTSVNALLAGLGITSLSTCTVIQPVDVSVLDDLGGRFGVPGTYLGKGN